MHGFGFGCRAGFMVKASKQPHLVSSEPMFLVLSIVPWSHFVLKYVCSLRGPVFCQFGEIPACCLVCRAERAALQTCPEEGKVVCGS